MKTLLLNHTITDDSQMLTLQTPSHVHSKHRLFRTGRKYDSSSISECKINLSYENWENVFDSTSDNDVNVIFNNILNTYLRIFYCSFPLHNSLVRNKCKGRLTKGILISHRHTCKKDLYPLCRPSNDTLENFYKKYFNILTSSYTVRREITLQCSNISISK